MIPYQITSLQACKEVDRINNCLYTLECFQMLDRVVKRRGLKIWFHQSNRGQTLLRIEFSENVGIFEEDVGV